MELGYIYKLTLLIDLESFKKGEVYIGKHDGKKQEYFGSGSLIKKIIKKHGKAVFEREILSEEINQEELLCYLEVYYISLYKCNRVKNGIGLNLTDGGEGFSGYKMTEEHRQNMLKSIKEAYEKRGKRPKAGKKLHQYDLKTGNYITSFEKCFDAAKIYNVTSSSIAYAARGLISSCAGFAWSYNKLDKYIVNPRGKKPIIQYDLQGNFIREWTSATDASKELGISNSPITNCCRNISKSSNGFIWKYKNENNV
jgi:hypothetical protein